MVILGLKDISVETVVWRSLKSLIMFRESLTLDSVKRACSFGGDRRRGKPKVSEKYIYIYNFYLDLGLGIKAFQGKLN